MNKKVLIVTYHFPPRPGIASLRLEGLAKYLPEFGWDPIILTGKLPSPPDPRYHVIETKDSDILLEWKKRFGFSPDRTFRDQLGLTSKKDTITDRLLNVAKEILAYPDYNKKWYRYALPAAQQLVKNETFDAIISSAGPYTAHIIAHDLKKEYNIPWIADFRDLWTQNHYYSYSRIRKHFERNLEVRIIANADAITTVSRPLAERLNKIHNAPIYVVCNGFDPGLLNHKTPLTTNFSISYTGRLYRRKMDPEPFLRALKKLIDKKKIDPSDLEVHFWGVSEDWIQKLVNVYHLENIVHLHCSIPYKEVIQKQRSSQILLLLTWNDPHVKGVIGGKIFEYLAAKRPILAIGQYYPEIDDILQECHAGTTINDDMMIEKILLDYYNQHKITGNVSYSGSEERICKYSHRVMAQRFAEIMNKIAK